MNNFGTTVGTTALMIAGMPNMYSAPDWATGTAYTIGSYVTSNGMIYVAMSTGTSGATAPTGVVDVSDGTVTWRPVLMHSRKGLIVTNNGTETVYLGLGSTAVANKGPRINGNGGVFNLIDLGPDIIAKQIEIWAVTASSTSSVTHSEW